MIKKFLIDLLFKLLNETPVLKEDINDIGIEKWLKVQANDPRAMDYVLSRNTMILRQIGKGLSREDYLIWVGRKTEALHLGVKLKKYAEKVEKEKYKRKK